MELINAAVLDEKVIVIDDFLRDVEQFRELALSASYPKSRQQQFFPGRNSAKRYGNAKIDEHVSRLTGDHLIPKHDTLHGSFRLCLEGETGKGGVHVDPCHWSGILHLSRPEDCRGGLDLFRYRENGETRAPIYQGDWAQWRMAREEFVHEVMLREATDPHKWELTQHVEMKFNRLVLFRPWLWHNTRPGFGDRPENGCLTFLMFYHALGSNRR